jgi:DNA repair photolyase
MKGTKHAFGTQEWAGKNVNIINGCAHDCRYCYAKEMAIRYKRNTKEGWKIETLSAKAYSKKYKKFEGTTMYPSTHDITPQSLPYSLNTIRGLLDAGNTLLIVSKAHLECVKKICESFEDFRSKILFRFTIGSSDSKVLKFWEPGAPSFEERFASLKYAFEEGFRTSVSCEPFLDEQVVELVHLVEPFVNDTVWLGKANSLLNRLKKNGYGDAVTLVKAHDLINKVYSETAIMRVYEALRNDPKVRWKESLKKVIGLPLSTVAGLDI